MNDVRIAHYDLLTVIVNRGRAAKVVHVAKEAGVPGATIALGWGTNNNRFWDFLGVANEDKDIVYMVSDPNTIEKAVDALQVELQLDKPNHGIAFVQDLFEVSGVHRLKRKMTFLEEGEETMTQLITVITERGRAEDVVEAARHAGAKGGTIVNARGSGVHETTRIFNMEVVPEKEIVMILCNAEESEGIMTAIEEELSIHEPGQGIMYLQPVLRAVGIRR